MRIVKPAYNVNLLRNTLYSLGEQRRQQALRLMAAHQRLVDNESMRLYQNYECLRLNITDEGAAEKRVPNYQVVVLCHG